MGSSIIASLIPWSHVCRMLDKVQSSVRASKKEMLLKFIRQFRELLKKKLQEDPNAPDSFFPVMRILLPALDRARGAYGVKERKLAELYIRILGLKKEGNDAQKLLHFRKPNSSAGSESGDFAEVAYYVLKNRCPDKGDMTLHDEVERSLMTMLRSMTATEQKWLMRVLLKDMRLGIGQGAIFNAWHPDAKDFYDVNNNLEKVCKTLRDPTIRLHEIEVSLFSAFRPMLAQQAVLDKVETQMDHKPFYAETKYDGERSQIHKKGNVYKYFSRNFGEHLDVKNLREEGDWHVCFCVFDIVYLNGEVLSNLPLRDRIEKIKTVIKPLEGRVMLSTRTYVKSKEDVIRVLNEAIDKREEGVVLKDPDSVYRPASRKGGWIKVKPEYVNSLVPELDLVIIGGYYGKGRHQGVLSHFLLGVAVPSGVPGGKPREFHSFCRIGSGYTVAELGELVDKLSPHTKVGQQPKNVVVSREKPDVWIDPVKSYIVQVRAAEIVKSDLYQAKVTLRFPRVEKVRYDKPWYDTLTTTELDQLVKEASGKLATKHYIDGGDEPSAKRKTQAKIEQPSLPLHFRPADLSNVVKKGEIFSGLEMCVMGGSDDNTKQQLETLLVEHGGSFTQHPGQNTHCIVTNTMSIRVKNYSSKHNVVRPSWIEDCTKSSRLLPWGPLDVMHLQKKEKSHMRDLFDIFGDSYTEPANKKSLKRVMDNMKKESWTPLSAEEMCELDEKTCDPLETRGLFRLITAFFCNKEEHHLASLMLRLHGGSVTNTLDNATHVVTGKESIQRPSEMGGRHLVMSDWIYDCVEKGKLFEPRYYVPKLMLD
ncbi:DNA ligase 4-like [Homarus americanus]|uniref:DNA ligase IV n=1 Tax=Homarus americanus TaxID=6706 RepID=A0A8J5MYH4_HOMAM|nr:DNA ligase 4-like [Homarus americanus]